MLELRKQRRQLKLTLLDAPQQMREHVLQKNIRQHRKVLCKHINYSVQSVITSCGHPL